MSSALRKPAPAPDTTPATRVIRRRLGEADVSIGGPMLSEADREAAAEIAAARANDEDRRAKTARTRTRTEILELLRGPPNNGTVSVSSARDRMGRSRGW